MTHGCLRLLVLLAVLPSVVVAQEESAPTAGGFDSTLKPFLNAYCLKCHGADEPRGDRDFRTLDGRIADSNAVVDYQDILDQLNLSEMPPSEADQPSDEERRAAVGWLTQRIRAYHAETNVVSTAAALRRLNSREYRNTVRDLMKLDMTMFRPEMSFPRDQVTDHLDNLGASLVTSGFLLARHLESAELIVEKAMSPVRKPEVQTWKFDKNFRQQPEIDQVHGKTNGFSYMTLYDVKGADKPEGAYGPILAFREGVPLDGFYTIQLRAEAVNRQHPYDPDFLGTDPTEPLRLGIVSGDHRVGPLHKKQPIEPLLAEFELADSSEWYEARVWLDAGCTPRFIFINGLMDVRGIWAKLIRKYPDGFPEKRRSGIVGDRFNAIKFGKLPQIHVQEIEIEGPFYDQWPTVRQQVLLGDDWESVAAGKEISADRIRAHYERFAALAYRRGSHQPQIDPVMRVYQARRKQGRTQLEAFGDGIKMILCSPHFLYLESGTEGTLSPTALASRLSYFLWSSMPDEALLSDAVSGEITRPDVLQGHVDRMLKDERSDALVNGLLESWLSLRDLGSMPPDRGDFRSFYHYDLDAAMREETACFVRYLIDEDLSVVNCLDSKFTFVNRPLAKFYGLKQPAGFGFEKVQLTDPRRGGLLGQASILTVSANGVDTSPVVRGVWVLENLLGDPPQPPPPDVEPLDPDTRGAKTIREQLQKHRTIASCNDCHRSIDPMGFALENYDPVGGWRNTYDRRVPIDASGVMPDGQQYKSIVEFKEILVKRREQFARALTNKMMSYATGRATTVSDRPRVDEIVDRLAGRGYGFRTLIQLIVESPTFQSP